MNAVAPDGSEYDLPILLQELTQSTEQPSLQLLQSTHLLKNLPEKIDCPKLKNILKKQQENLKLNGFQLKEKKQVSSWVHTQEILSQTSLCQFMLLIMLFMPMVLAA